MNAAIYVRVSTTENENSKSYKGQTVENQLPELIAYCKTRGWDYTIYEDDISAVKRRPGLEWMLDAARRRVIDVVVVWKIDRFARSMKDFVTLTQILDSAGVRFIATTQGIDTDCANSANKLLMNVIVSMAEFESSLISERTKAGLARRKAQGKPLGRHLKIFNVEEAQRLHDIEGMSWRTVAKHLGVKKSTILGRLKGDRREKGKVDRSNNETP